MYYMYYKKQSKRNIETIKSVDNASLFPQNENDGYFHPNAPRVCLFSQILFV